MNPHTKDFRHHALTGEKTGSPFQSDRAFRRGGFPPAGMVVIALLAAPFAWAGIIWAGMAVFRSW